MASRWQISAGEITEWLPLLLYAFAAFSSVWVLQDARVRRFRPYAVAAWTLATLISAPIFLPLYLIARTFKASPAAHHHDDATDITAPKEIDAPGDEETDTTDTLRDTATGAPALEKTDAPGVVAAGGDIAADAGERRVAAGSVEQVAGDSVEQVAAGSVEQVAAADSVKLIADRAERDAADSFEGVAPGDAPQVARAAFSFKRHAPTLVYACALLCAGAFYFYRDYHSFDAHLARAANARLRSRRPDAIREYRAALRLADDAHTHKLLGIQLAEDGQMEAALAELRAAERGGEPDELLTFRLASALDALGRTGEAADEYQKFSQGNLCARPSPDALCAEATARLRQIRGGGGEGHDGDAR